MIRLRAITLFDQAVEFNGYVGRVSDVQSWTESRTWVTGSSGYVPLQAGGALVYAPSVHTRSTRHQRIRVDWGNGKQSSVELGGNIPLSIGDQVGLLSMENLTERRWGWVGLVNQTLGRSYHLPTSQPIASYRTPSALKRYGRLWAGLDHSAKSWIVTPIIISLLLRLAIFVWFPTAKAGIGATATYAALVFGSAVVFPWWLAKKDIQAASALCRKEIDLSLVALGGT
jgi:hypothetical protein